MKSDYSNMSIDDLQMCLIKSKTLDKSAMLRSLIKQQKEIKRLKNLNYFLENEIATLRTGAVK